MPPPDLIHQGHLDFITSLLLQTIDKHYDDIQNYYIIIVQICILSTPEK